ncbi:MAG TPA: XdhC/CoxI family protein [Candidatus Xenobia bacterium]|jgi:xanthine dehydrogenase accessory factor
MEKREVFARMGELSDTRFAVATVVGTKGSTPREAGAKMVIRGDGSFFGTIGGGCGEAEVWAEARRALRTGENSRVLVDLTESADEGGEKICGGKMDVLVDVWEPSHTALLKQILGDVHGQVLATWVKTGRKALVEDPRTGLVELDGEEVFLERLERPPLLIVVGAGHVAQPLVSFAHRLGFRVAVLDDRPEWATVERFRDADTVLSGAVSDNLRGFALQPGTYVVLVTRGHKYDEEALRVCLPYPLSYVGMIGSKRRVRAVFTDLEREGWTAEQLDKVYSPIGLDIGAETPEEIAVAILAEIIKLRRGRGKGESLSVRSAGSPGPRP